MKKYIIIGLVIAVLAGGFYFYKTGQVTKADDQEVQEVKILEVKPEAITTTVTAEGKVKTGDEKLIKARMGGLIAEIYPETGDFIEKGEKILKLDDEALKEDLEDAKLTFEEARKNYQGLLKDYKEQGNLNKLKLNEAQKNLEIARTNLEQEKINLEKEKDNLETMIAELKEDLERSKKEVKDKRKLYVSGAIPEKQLTEAKDRYNKILRDYQSKKGDLQQLEEKTIPNRLKLASLNVENALNKLEVMKATIARDKITENDLELAKIKIKKAKNKINDINKRLARLLIRSNREGTVVNLDIEEGDKLTEGQTIVSIANIDNLIVEAMVDEVDINEVQIGQDVNITSDSFPGSLKGKVDSIAPVATKVGNINKFPTEIIINDVQKTIKPGMFVNSDITTAHRENVITLPPMAVLGDREKYVFVNNNGKAEKREVKPGLRNLTRVEVKGINSGEKVIIGPFTTLKKLREGSPVVNIEVSRKSGE